MKVTNAQQLSAYIKEARLTNKLPQTAISSKVGIRQDTVSSFENNPSATKLDTLFKILAALNLELDVKARENQMVNAKSITETTTSNAHPHRSWQEEW